MLVIMKDRDIALFLKFFLDLKTSWSGNILKIDTSKAAGNHIDSIWEYYQNKENIEELLEDDEEIKVTT